MPYTPFVLRDRELQLPKAIVAPQLGARTVLTNEPWNYVDLALSRQNQADAQFYWQQASEFYSVSKGLPVRSSPLLLYYSFMNAVKALLSAKGVAFSPKHGVSKLTNPDGVVLQGLQIGIDIKAAGILPSLATYYGEPEPRRQHSLEDIFHNLPYIHRTFGLTYPAKPEVYIPLRHHGFVFEEGTTNIFLLAELSSHFSTAHYMAQLPPSLVPFPAEPLSKVISASSITISSVTHPTPTDMTALAAFARTFRRDIFYINGTETLWYIKSLAGGAARIERQTTTLTLGAMHRLSELCRYHPKTMVSFLRSDDNWLFHEFITMSGVQFIDEIASEITGQTFLMPNVRAAV